MNKKIKELLAPIYKQIILILVALLIATIFLALSDYEPLAIIKGVIYSFTNDFPGTIRWSIPLILSGLAVCITYKSEFFNLGVDGQIYIGASAATIAALSMPKSVPAFLAISLVILVAMIAGALYAMIPALMKVYLNTNEVVSTILFNFIASLFVEFLVSGPMLDRSEGTNLNASPIIPENTWMPRISFMQPSTANIGIILAIIIAIVMAFIFFKTTLGHEIKIVGANPVLAKYSGMNPKKNVIQVMLISGGIAGLVGAIEVMAIQHRLLPGFNPDFGFDGIVVSLLGNNNPIGVFFSGIFFGALKNGGVNMERMSDVPSAVSDIVIAIVILIIGVKLSVPIFKKLQNKKRNSEKEAAK